MQTQDGSRKPSEGLMRWDFWHVVLALIIAVVAAALIISIVTAVVGVIIHLLQGLLIVAVVVGVIYLAYRVFVPHRRDV
jgi:pheromone shutdown protein TraB